MIQKVREIDLNVVFWGYDIIHGIEYMEFGEQEIITQYPRVQLKQMIQINNLVREYSIFEFVMN
jgi:hypothetical protein